MPEIRIYVEGGGNEKETKAFFRKGFTEFLKDLRDHARQFKVQWNVVACGSREETYKNFRIACQT
ncbi:MAG: hypothetical protein C4527_27610 [Candidatus Omnitrophota bacterium]|jgi:hypothetical protein|nr:MAG: hypothetical protein C4527_27610 [Candidatus Omnitrophota bacterium]